MLTFIKAHKAWLISAGLGLVSFFTPAVTSWVQHNPQYATTVGALWGVLMAVTKSPRQ